MNVYKVSILWPAKPGMIGVLGAQLQVIAHDYNGAINAAHNVMAHGVTTQKATNISVDYIRKEAEK